MVKRKITFYCDILCVTRQEFYWYLKHRDEPWKYEGIAEKIRSIVKKDECNDTYGRCRMYQALKLKYLADNDFGHLSGEALRDAIAEAIKKKDTDLKGQMVSEGTTPRRLTDLIGSLCDLTSGSGDKGTPIVLVQNYFNNFAD